MNYFLTTNLLEWNSVPLSVICAFPYILAFSTDAIEFRYAVNGSLLQTLCMPELKLISSKVSIYYRPILWVSHTG